MVKCSHTPWGTPTLAIAHEHKASHWLATSLATTKFNLLRGPILQKETPTYIHQLNNNQELCQNWQHWHQNIRHACKPKSIAYQILPWLAKAYKAHNRLMPLNSFDCCTNSNHAQQNSKQSPIVNKHQAQWPDNPRQSLKYINKRI